MKHIHCCRLKKTWNNGETTEHIFVSDDGERFLEVGEEPQDTEAYKILISKHFEGNGKTTPMRIMRRWLQVFAEGEAVFE